MSEHTAREVIELLNDNGYFEKNIRGDHHQFENFNGNKIPVNYKHLKDPVRIGTYKNIVRAIRENQYEK